MNKSELRKKAKENGWDDADIFQMFASQTLINIMITVPKDLYTIGKISDNKKGE